MSGLQKLPLTVVLCLLLVATLLPSSEARRGRGGGSFGRGGGGYNRGWGGGGGGYRPLPAQSSGPSAAKVAGAAAAGAIGGSMLGSALSRPGYGYGGGYGGYGGGYGGYGGGYGYPRYGGGGYGGGYGPRPGYESEGSGDMEYYTGASSGPIYNSIIVVIGSLMSLLIGHWVAVM